LFAPALSLLSPAALRQQQQASQQQESPFNGTTSSIISPKTTDVGDREDHDGEPVTPVVVMCARRADSVVSHLVQLLRRVFLDFFLNF
jgi:hypothetical protein